MRSIFGLMGLIDMIDGLYFTIENPSKSTAAHHLLSMAASVLRTLSVFSSTDHLNNENLSWKTLVYEYEGRTHRVSEAKRIRALLNHLWLDNYTSGYENRYNFSVHIKRLDELRSTLCESTRAGILPNLINNPDCNHAVEI